MPSYRQPFATARSVAVRSAMMLCVLSLPALAQRPGGTLTGGGEVHAHTETRPDAATAHQQGYSSSGLGGDERVDDLVARGDLASAARRSTEALMLYEQALRIDSMAFPALWRTSRELIDLGEFETDRKLQRERYTRAETLARRALAQHPEQADVHFHVARAVGRIAMVTGARHRLGYAMEVREHAMNALALDPRHAGALHIMGVWNAEVMRLNGLMRVIAENFLGGRAMNSANWDEARRYLERAVALEPDHIVHHLDLARTYRDMGRPADARASYEAAIAAPLIDANDDRYRGAAVTELKALGQG